MHIFVFLFHFSLCHNYHLLAGETITDQARHSGAQEFVATNKKEDCLPNLIGLDRSRLAKPGAACK